MTCLTHRYIVAALVFVVLLGTVAKPHGQANDQAAAAVRAETEAALAKLGPAVEQAEVRWRREFVGKIKSRAGAPVAEAEVLTEVRRASQTIAGATPRIQTLAADLQQRRMSTEQFGAELDALFEQAVVTTWDIHLTEARRAIAVAQEQVSAAANDLQERWSRIVGEIGNRPGLTVADRQQLIDAAAPPVREAERQQLNAAGAQLDAVARRLTQARRTLVDLVAARIASAREAKRMTAAGGLNGLIEAHLESVGPDPAATASSFDQLLAAAQVNVPTVVIRGQPQRLALADRIRPMLASGAAPIGQQELVRREPNRTPWIFATIPIRQALTADPRNPNASTPGEPGVTLAVFGAYLIERGTGTVASGTPGVEYSVLSSLAGAFERTRLPGNDPLRPLYDAAVAAARKDLPPAEGSAFELMDVLLVNAKLKRGMLPSLQTFTLAGVEGLWPLKSATTRGTIEFVRPRPARLADEVDRPDEVFVFDRFAVQIETEDPLEVDELPVVVVHNGAPLVPRRNADTAHADGAPADAQKGLLIARKVPGFPRLLRTRPVFIEGRVTAGPLDKGMHYTPMKEGDVVFATTDGMIFDAPVADGVTVYQGPDRVRVLFSQAIADAARINKKEVRDLNIADERVVDTITHTVVFNWQRHKIDFSLFDHAALLLMKRTFLRLAEDRLAPLEAIYKSDDAIRAHIPAMKEQFEEMRRLRRDSEHGDIPFPLLRASLRVPPNLELLPQSPDEVYASRFGVIRPLSGERWFQPYGTAPISTAFWDGQFVEWFKDPGKIGVWQFYATREALRLQIEQMKGAIRYAESCDDDEVEELLELAGRGFGPVRQQIFERLLYLKSDVAKQTMEWLPHERARVAVTNLASTLEEHETAYKASRADTEALLAAVTAIGVVATGGAAIVGKVILAAASTVAIGVATKDVVALQLDKAETQFARNAIDIIGRDRFLFAYQRDAQIGAMPYVTLALSVVGARLDIADMVNAVRMSAARQVAEQWMKHVANEGFDALTQIPIKDKSIVYLLMQEAEAAKAAGQKLTPVQQSALEASALLDRQAAAADNWRGRTAAAAYRPDEHVIIPSPVRGRIMDHAKIPDGMPPPGYIVEDASGGLFLVGQPIGKGAYATTYRLLDDSIEPTDDVIKFLREPWRETRDDFLRGRAAAKDARVSDLDQKALTTFAPFDRTPLPEVIDRMLESQKLLENAKIPHLPMRGLDDPLARAGREADPPFVVQRQLPEDAVLLPDDVLTGLPVAGMDVAVAKLYKQLADAGLVWKDGHFQNIYFQKINDEWVAGILDPDMIVKWDAPIESDFLRRQVMEAFANAQMEQGMRSVSTRFDLQEALEKNQTFPDILQRVSSSSLEFMAKMLEHKGWIRYTRRGLAPPVFESGLIDIDAVRRYFGDPAQYVKR